MRKLVTMTTVLAMMVCTLTACGGSSKPETEAALDSSFVETLATGTGRSESTD